jgi:predicted TIM-barrel fold metal-dependent hydrolase
MTALAEASRRRVAPEELRAITARYSQRFWAETAFRVGEPPVVEKEKEKVMERKGGGCCRCGCPCSAGSGHPSSDEVEAKSRGLEERVARLEAELEAMRMERDMLTPSVMSDCTETS